MIKFYVLLVLVFVTGSVFGQKAYLIKQDLPIGKKYSFNMISEQFITQKIGDQTINLNQTIGTEYTFAIRNGDGLEKDVQVIYDRIYMKSEVGGKTMNMDSDDQNTEKVNPFRKLKGASFTMIMLPNGAIKSISGIDKMVSDMASSTSTDTAVVNSLKLSLAKQFNTETLKETMESSLKVYPDQPIKVGESWTVVTENKMAMPMQMTSHYTLKEVKNNIAYLNISGTLISKGNFEAMSNAMETDLTGTNSGDAELDLKTGLIMNSHFRIEMEGTIKSMGQSIGFKLQGLNKIVAKEIQ